MHNSLDPDEARHFVGPDLSPNCLQTTKVASSGQRVKCKTTCWYYTFWLKPWLKLISFDSIFFLMTKVLATTNFEPGLALSQTLDLLIRNQPGENMVLFII